MKKRKRLLSGRKYRTSLTPLGGTTGGLWRYATVRVGVPLPVSGLLALVADSRSHMSRRPRSGARTHACLLPLTSAVVRQEHEAEFRGGAEDNGKRMLWQVCISYMQQKPCTS
jgi:hypothetical protein